MAALFSKPKAPPVAAATPPPERTSDQIAEAAAKQREAFYGASSGRASTILTNFGSTDEMRGVASKLLGNTGR